MKLILLTIVSLLFVVTPVVAGKSESAFEKSKKAYYEKNYAEAITLLEAELKKEPRNPSLYFNIGLAYKGEKKYAKAIWAFEKSLKLNANDTESIQLIEACYQELNSNQTWKSDTGTFQRALFSMGSNFWSLMAIVFSILAALFIIRMQQIKVIQKKKNQLGLAIASCMLLLVSVYIASGTYNYERAHDYAIVIDNNVAAFNSENLSDQDTSKIELNPGTKVRVIKWSKSGRKAIETPKGQKVYIESGVYRI